MPPPLEAQADGLADVRHPPTAFADPVKDLFWTSFGQLLQFLQFRNAKLEVVRAIPEGTGIAGGTAHQTPAEIVGASAWTRVTDAVAYSRAFPVIENSLRM